jgi:hypothetical protein
MEAPASTVRVVALRRTGALTGAATILDNPVTKRVSHTDKVISP